MTLDILPSTALWFLPFALPICLWVMWSDLKAMKIPNMAVMALVAVFVIVGFFVHSFACEGPHRSGYFAGWGRRDRCTARLLIQVSQTSRSPLTRSTKQHLCWFQPPLQEWTARSSELE